MNTSPEIDKIAAAMVQVQAQMKPAVKDATNPHFRTKYADLSAIWEACRKPLSDNGIFAAQDVTSDDHSVSVVTRLTHVSGQWMEFGPLRIPLSKHDAQGVGSGTSYGKRYSLSAALGVVAEDDDDGNRASERTPEQRQQDRRDNAAATQRVADRVREQKAQTNGHAAPPPNVNPQTGEITDDGLLTVRNVAETSGTNSKSGKAWTKFTIHFSDGSKASTFSGTFGDLAKKAKREGLKLRVLTKQGQYGAEIEALDVVTAEAPASGGLEEPGLMDESIPF